MKIITLPTKQAVGHLSVQAVPIENGKIKKGHILTSSDVDALHHSGVTNIVCAIAETNEMHEDEAASLLAKHLCSEHIIAGRPATGRVNFTAASLGIIRYDSHQLKELNMCDEAITLAAVQHNQLLSPGDMIATLKIIPFFVSCDAVHSIIARLKQAPLWHFHPLSEARCSLIQTCLPHQPRQMFDATERVTQNRVSQLGGMLISTTQIPHEETALASALNAELSEQKGADLILISGASAITHRDDLIPSAVRAAGGEIDHLGIAVDPGNLLMIAHIGAVTVIGMPGCARSPKLNGLDWVLHLILAKIPVNSDELAGMAAGGLLMEIASRPLPRALIPVPTRRPRVEGVLLAAGRSLRMGRHNKILAELNGIPMIKHIVHELLTSRLDGVTVILGHDAEAVADAISDSGARLVLNPDYRSGQSSSVRCGLNHLPHGTTDMMIILADMPFITSAVIDQLIDNHFSHDDRHSRITVPEVDGTRGNPVLWGASFFDEIKTITGDKGAKDLLVSYASAITPVAFSDTYLLTDTDTPEALADVQEIFKHHLSQKTHKIEEGA